MDSSKLLTIGLLLGVFYVIVIAAFTKAIFQWEPIAGKRISLILLLWLLPFIGIIVVYRVLDLGWFRREHGHDSSSAIASGFLEMDAVFNPGSRHRVENSQEQKMEVRKEGELFNQVERDKLLK